MSDNPLLIEEPVETSIAIYEPYNKQLQEFKDKYDNIVYNLDDPNENKQARSDSNSIGSLVGKLEVTRKEAKAPYQDKVKVIDSQGKILRDSLRAVQSKIKVQIVEHGENLQRIEELLLAKVNRIQEFSSVYLSIRTSSEMQQLINKLTSIVVDESYGKYMDECVINKMTILDTLQVKYDLLVQAEKDAEELKQLRESKAIQDRLQEEAKLKLELAQEAKEEAERQAQLKIDLALAEANKVKYANEQLLVKAKLEKDRLAQEILGQKKLAEQLKQKAIDDAKAEVLRTETAKLKAVEDERLRIVEVNRAKAEKKAAEQAIIDKRAKDLDYRKSVAIEICNDFEKQGIKSSAARRIITMIDDGLIGRVSIDFS